MKVGKLVSVRVGLDRVPVLAVVREVNLPKGVATLETLGCKREPSRSVVRALARIYPPELAMGRRLLR